MIKDAFSKFRHVFHLNAKPSIAEKNELEAQQMKASFLEKQKFLRENIDTLLTEYQPLYLVKDNVLQMKFPLTFGVEIEFKIEESKIFELLKTLSNYNLLEETKIYDKEKARKLTKWRLSKEANDIYELISPVLHDAQECWSVLQIICSSLQEQGAYINEHCAFHIHIGNTDSSQNQLLFSEGSQWIALRELYHRLEPLTYTLSAGNEIAIPQKRIEFYSVPFVIADKSLYKKGYTIQQSLIKIKNNEDEDNLLLSMYCNKLTGLNLRNMTKSLRTIEFRTFNGTLDPITMQTYLFYVTSIIRKARETNFDISQSGQSKAFCTHLISTNEAVLNLEYVFEVLDFLDYDAETTKRIFHLSKANDYVLPLYVHQVLSGVLNEEKRNKLLY